MYGTRENIDTINSSSSPRTVLLRAHGDGVRTLYLTVSVFLFFLINLFVIRYFLYRMIVRYVKSFD